jgi:hypothetical protein
MSKSQLVSTVTKSAHGVALEAKTYVSEQGHFTAFFSAVSETTGDLMYAEDSVPLSADYLGQPMVQVEATLEQIAEYMKEV